MALIKCKSSPLTNNNLMPIHLTVVITVFLVLSGFAVQCVGGTGLLSPAQAVVAMVLLP